MNVAVVVSGGLTETLQAGPLITAAAAVAGDPVLVACPPSAAELCRGLAGAGEVMAIRGLAGRAGGGGLLRLWVELRRRRLDAVVLCSESAPVHVAAYMAAVPRRVGSAAGLSALLLSDRVRNELAQNRAVAWLGLAGALGAAAATAHAQLTLGSGVTAVAEDLLLSRGVSDGRLLVAIAPGSGFAEEPGAAWGAERFAHLANRLASRHGAGVILVGDERDRAAAEAMRVDLAADSVDLCGEVNLPTTAAVIARCDLLIGTDTPLLHLAAIMGVATIGIFGATDGRRRAPAGAQHRVVQALADSRMPATVDRVLVDDVLAGIESPL